MRWCTPVLSLLLSVSPAFAESTLDFAEGLPGWSRRSFAGETDYRAVTEQGQTLLRAESRGQASALYRQQTVDLTDTPWLEWRWRVDRIYSGLDPLTRAGDDFPARVYVVVRTGLFPWQTLALNYVWANGPPPAPAWANPFTDKAMMIPLQSGAAAVGEWRSERVNVRADFRRWFGRDISELDGVAIMTDGDNSNSSATAWYGPLQFTP